MMEPPRTSIQIPRFLDLVVSLTHISPQNFQLLLPLLKATLDNIRSTDVLMLMNVIQFYTNLLESSPSPEILTFLEPKLPYLINTLSPDADAFQSLMGAGTCEFLTALRTRPEFKRLDQRYGILKALEGHAFNLASPQHVPALLAISKIAATEGMREYIDPKVMETYRKIVDKKKETGQVSRFELHDATG